MFLAVLYVQNVLGLSPGRAALYFPALNIAVIAGSLTGPRLLTRLGATLRGDRGPGTGHGRCADPDHAAQPWGPDRSTADVVRPDGVRAGHRFGGVDDRRYQRRAAHRAWGRIGVAELRRADRDCGRPRRDRSAHLAGAEGPDELLDGMRPGFIGAALIAVLGMAAAWMLPRKPMSQAVQHPSGSPTARVER